MLLVVFLAACGSGERTFSAESFVEEANGAGAGLKLGSELYTTQGSHKVYGVELERDGKAGKGHEHGGGSLTVEDDAGLAKEELARCRSAGTLVCYRGANVVLSLDEDVGPRDQDRIASALRRMAGD